MGRSKESLVRREQGKLGALSALDAKAFNAALRERKDMNDTSHRWTTEELMRFVAEWNLGTPIAEMVTIFNCGPTAIRAQVVRLRQQGVPLPRRRAGNMAGKYGIPWTQADVEYLIRRRKEGATGEAIAVELGRTFHSIQGMAQNLRKNGVIEPKGAGRRRLWDLQAVRASAVMDNIIPIERGKKAA